MDLSSLENRWNQTTLLKNYEIRYTEKTQKTQKYVRLVQKIQTRVNKCKLLPNALKILTKITTKKLVW